MDFRALKKKKAAYTSCWNISGGFNGSNGGAAGAAEQWGVPGIKRKPDGCLDGTEFLHLNQTGNGITADYSRCSQLSNLSLHVYDSLVFDLLGEMCMRCSVCVCMYVIRYVGCWPLKTANKVCSLSLVCVRKMGPAKWVCVHVCFGVGEFDCVCVN